MPPVSLAPSMARDVSPGGGIPFGPLVPIGNLWPLGDSITWGQGPEPPPGGCGYRDPLYVSMAAAGMGATHVGTLTGGQDVATCPISGIALANDGHVGFICSQIQSGAPGWYASIPSPRVILLDIGTNDLIRIATGVPGCSLAQTIADFDSMLAVLVGLNPNIFFFVSNMQPMPNLTVIPEFAPFNAHIASRVTAYRAAGRNMYLVDLFTCMNSIAEPNPGADFNSGGVHPNASGYTKMAARWFSTIQAAA